MIVQCVRLLNLIRKFAMLKKKNFLKNRYKLEQTSEMYFDKNKFGFISCKPQIKVKYCKNFLVI